MINANLVAVGSRKRPKKPKRYERPTDSENTRTLGSGDAMPRDEFRAWLEQKRADRAKMHEQSRENHEGGET